MEGRFFIIGSSKKRAFEYAAYLQGLNKDYCFFSNFISVFFRMVSSELSLLIVDHVDEVNDLSMFIKEVRQVEKLQDLVVIIITKERGCSQGLKALEAGADDYISFDLVEKELAVRVNAHLQKKNKNIKSVLDDFDFEYSLSLEDRFLLRESLIYIEKNLSSLRKVKNLSLHTGKSERYLNKIFKSQLDQTVFEYIRDFRIKKAKELILTTRILIIDIAEEVGYSSAENFSTAFKAAVGLSPTEYRKQKRRIKK